jgi:hypothetical protein
MTGSLTCRPTSVMRRSRRPCYRSAGNRLFNLRMTSPREMGWRSGFGCEASFVRCSKLLSRITSCTVGIPRSLWIISLVTYHGASTIAGSILDWHRSITAHVMLRVQLGCERRFDIDLTSHEMCATTEIWEACWHVSRPELHVRSRDVSWVTEVWICAREFNVKSPLTSQLHA